MRIDLIAVWHFMGYQVARCDAWLAKAVDFVKSTSAKEGKYFGPPGVQTDKAGGAYVDYCLSCAVIGT